MKYSIQMVAIIVTKHKHNTLVNFPTPCFVSADQSSIMGYLDVYIQMLLDIAPKMSFANGTCDIPSAMLFICMRSLNFPILIF